MLNVESRHELDSAGLFAHGKPKRVFNEQFRSRTIFGRIVVSGGFVGVATGWGIKAADARVLPRHS